VKTIIRDARILTMDRDGPEHARATVAVQDGVITSVDLGNAPGPAGAADVREINGAGHLLMPGLINAHFHSSVNHLKGSLDGLPLEVFMLYESPADGAATDPRAIYVRTLLGALEMLKSGVTTVLDDAFFVPAPTAASIDAVMQAYADSGMRATLALDQPNVAEIDKLPFLGDLLPPALRARAAAPPVMDSDGLLGCYRHLLTRWHGAAGGRLRAAVSCSAPQRVTHDYFQALDDLSRAHDLPFYMHVLETKLQRVFGEERLGGRSLIRYVRDAGLLSERLNIIHGIWLDEQDMDLIAEASAVIAHNPVCNLRLGSGVMPFRQLRARGIPICLGSDEAIADDSVNMWAVAKLAGLIHNITSVDYQHWPTATEILDCLLRGGARATRSPVPIGQIAVGHQADLILVDLDTLAFTPLNDLHRQLVYCESGSSVRMTMVAGRIVYEHGQVNGIDERALRAEAREHAERRRVADVPALQAAAEWLPFYRQMYLKAAGRNVGLQRWVGGAQT
jgi:5-methylthioadenosine/S-adenosylhomocysteine deaminase